LRYLQTQMPKGKPGRPRTEVELEYVLRIKRNRILQSECTFRGQRVEVVSYWPNGMVESHGAYDIDDFITIMKKVQDTKEKP
jgi:hypothetical protein